MNADILLLYPPTRTLHYQSSIPYLSAYLKEKGFKPDVLDVPALGLKIDQVIKYIENSQPKTIGVSIPFTPLAETGLELIRTIRSRFPNQFIICGGVHPTLQPEEFTDFVNVVVIGEGEETLTDLLKHKLNSENYFHIKGLAYSHNEEMTFTAPRDTVDLDFLPIPDWDIVAVHKYKLILPTGERAIPIQSSRGCPYSCNFCSNHFLSNRRVRYKSIENTIKELKHYIEKFGICSFDFRDETFTLDRKRVIALCEIIIQEKMGIRWWIQTRANLVDDSLLQTMREAGCIGVSIGVETGDPFILRKISKGISLPQTKEAVKLIRKAGLLVCANFIIGHPWDTPVTVKKTMKFADELNPDYVGFALATPFPKTELREEAIKNGVITTESWGDYLTNKVTYIPPGLEDQDLLKLRRQAESYFYLRNARRILLKISSIKGVKSRLSFLKRIVSNYPMNTPQQFPSSVIIGERVYLDGNIVIGPNTYINSYSHIVSGPNTRVTIGQGCAISYNVHIRGRMHNPQNILEIIEGDIEIGNKVWIGANAIVREGINIGDNAIVGGNSVVTHNVPPNHVVGGVPARTLYVKPKQEEKA